MKNLLTAGAALLLTTSLANAGGLDRSGQPVGILFEDGNVVQLSFGYINPEVTGVTVDNISPFPADLNSGNVAEDYSQFGGGVKFAVSDDVDVAVIFDQPYGAKVSYADADTGYYTNPPAASNVLAAEASSSSITALARYKFDENMSVYGGVRYQTVGVEVDFPLVGDYQIESEDSSATGFVVGAAYEIPAIALRVALTYNSKIKHEMKTSETCTIVVAAGSPPVLAPFCNGTANETTTAFETPESFNLDFQSGIAEDTLLFGSIRYAKWTQFDFRPETFATATGMGDPDAGASLQDYDDDTLAYSLGVGRRFSDMFAGAVSVGYEPAQGGFSGPLAPTDGNMSFGVGGTFTQADYDITVGARYIMIGDADLAVPGTDIKVAEFADNSAVAIGVQISRNF